MLGFITGSLSHGFPRVLDYINMCSLFFHSIEKRKGVKLYLCVYGNISGMKNIDCTAY